MALQKAITDERGVTAAYFRITAIIGQYASEIPIITIQLLGYADGTYRDKEKLSSNQNLSNTFKEVYLSVNDQQGYTRADIYKRLSTEIPDFAGSKEI